MEGPGHLISCIINFLYLYAFFNSLVDGLGDCSSYHIRISRLVSEYFRGIALVGVYKHIFYVASRKLYYRNR